MPAVDVIAASFLLISFSIALTAQATPSPNAAGAASSQPQTIHLDVLVKDKEGMPVTGLSQQVFTVLDNGQPQKPVSFTPMATRNDPSAVSVLIVIDMINPGFD